MVKSLPCNTGDVDSIPGWGTKIVHATGQLNKKIFKKMIKTSLSLKFRKRCMELKQNFPVLNQWSKQCEI